MSQTHARSCVLGLALLSYAVATPLVADQQPGWALRFYPELVSPDLGKTLEQDEDGSIGLTGRDAIGVGFGAEYRFSRRLGLELSLSRSEPELVLQVRDPAIASIDVASDFRLERVGLALPIHLTPDSRADLWIGPSVSWYRIGNWSIAPNDFQLSFADELGYGFTAGLDVPLTDRLALHVGASYHDVDISPRVRGQEDEDLEGVSLPLDPFTVRVGLAMKL